MLVPPLPKSRSFKMGAAKGPRAGGRVTTYPPGSSPRRLPDGSEARGQLLSVSCADGCALASFEWGSVAFPEEIREELAGRVGRTVAVLRLDGKYHCRAV